MRDGTLMSGSAVGTKRRALRFAEREARIDRVGRLALLGVLALWVFVPEVRRLVDWKHGFSSISVISAFPLVALVPFLFFLRDSRRPRQQAPVIAIAVLWAGIFAYALVIGVAQGSAAAAVYAYMLAVLPAVVGVWIGTRCTDPGSWYRDIARFLLWTAAIISIYGIYQYVAAPPWDTAWMQQSGMNSNGIPKPYMIRVFSVLNAPAAFGDFLALVLLVAFPILTWRSIPLVTLMLAALVLSQLREAWIGLVIGVIALFCLSPRRIGGAAALGASVAVCVLAISIIPYVTGTLDVQKSIVTRLTTFGQLSSDISAVDRWNQMDSAYRKTTNNPLGAGLGELGTAAKLSSASAETEVLDSGFLSRFVEMGVLGTFAYIGVLLAGIVIVSRIWWAERGPDRRDARSFAAVALSVQIMLFAIDFFGDKHLALNGLIFWIVLGLVRLPGREARHQ